MKPKSKTDKRWNKDVRSRIGKLGPVKNWLARWVDDPSTDWQSQKSAHHAIKFIEMAEFEMWNMQWWRNNKEQELYLKAEETVN